MRELKQSTQSIQASLSKALDNHFMTCAAVAAATVVAGQTEEAQAAIHYSGPQNIVLPNATGGLYINMVTNLVSDNPGSVPGWDLNPYINASGSTYFAFWAPSSVGTKFVEAPSGGADVAMLTSGALIGPESTFEPYLYGFMSNASAGAWIGTGTGFVGVMFTEAGVNGGNPLYGWVQISKTIPGQPPPTGDSGITFIDWAYDDSGAAIAAGATVAPEPSSLALLAAGAVGLLARRGQVKLRRADA